jgi:pimeloyl-ACP methyl ester carboxylesterase
LGTDGLTSLQTMLAGQDEGSPSNPSAGLPSPLANFGGVLQTYLAYHLHGDPIAARLAEIDIPALILHGTADEEISFAEAERLQAGLPQAVLVPFEDGGHRIMVTHAESYTQAVTSFLHRMG